MIVSPWMDTEDAAIYLRFKGPRALKSCREWLKANQVPTKKRGKGGKVLVLRSAIDEALQDGWQSRRLRKVAG